MSVPINPATREQAFDLLRDGFELRRSVVSSEQVGTLLMQLSTETQRSTNRRSLLRDCPAVAELAMGRPLRTIASEALGGGAFVVRALLFDKVSGANWGVPWHQDLAIAVEEKIDVAGFSGWSVKDGIRHVLPPAEILAQMVTLRLHLDDCGEDNGPLRLLPGSHRGGKLSDADIERCRAVAKEFVCLADHGDVLVMRPLVLHASSAAENPGHRRVLHIEYAVQSLPGGLRWAAQRAEN